MPVLRIDHFTLSACLLLSAVVLMLLTNSTVLADSSSQETTSVSGQCQTKTSPRAAHSKGPECRKPVTIDIWKAKPLDESEYSETILADKGDKVRRITDISKPNMTVYFAPNHGDATPAVVVCPGGGYSILAINLEGTEIAEWLNSIGITAIVLKYRVPNQRDNAFADVQRAMRLVRSNATAWNINPESIGVIGFSAGGHLSARLSTGFDKPAYEAADEHDKISCRPDFAMLIYPAYLVTRDNKLADQIRVSGKTPPTFIIQTLDDAIRVENALFYCLALKKASVPAEMHIYPKGGHGYGLRPSGHEVSNWPALCRKWLDKSGIIDLSVTNAKSR